MMLFGFGLISERLNSSHAYRPLIYNKQTAGSYVVHGKPFWFIYSVTFLLCFFFLTDFLKFETNSQRGRELKKKKKKKKQ